MGAVRSPSCSLSDSQTQLFKAGRDGWGKIITNYSLKYAPIASEHLGTPPEQGPLALESRAGPVTAPDTGQLDKGPPDREERRGQSTKCRFVKLSDKMSKYSVCLCSSSEPLKCRFENSTHNGIWNNGLFRKHCKST